MSEGEPTANTFHQGCPFGISQIEDRGITECRRDSMITLGIMPSAPEMDPIALREIDLALGAGFLPDRSNQNVRTEQVFKLFAVAAQVVFIMQEEGTLYRDSGFGILSDQKLKQRR